MRTVGTVRTVLAASFLWLVAAPALPQAVPARAIAPAAAPSASVEREGDALVIRWTGLKAPVGVRVATRPDARWAESQAVLAQPEGDGARVRLPLRPRPYVVLRDAGGREMMVAERVLPLEGGQNFRDLGGYEAAGGTVAWGKLYRSGDPSGLTAADLNYLSGLGIATVCDLRSTSERDRAPSRLGGEGRLLLERDYALDMGGFGALFAGGAPSADKARAMFAQFYRDVPFQFAGDYRAMVRALVEGKAPLAFNCSAGKDRTGVGAAIILKLLGASRETIVGDYLLSNRYYRPQPPAPGAAVDPSLAMFAKLPPDVVQVLMGVEPAYIEAALDAIDARPGGFEAYARDDLGLTEADIATLRRRYVVRGRAMPGNG